MSNLLSLEQAQARLLGLAPRATIESVPPETALGRYLAYDLAALRTHPPADLSAMDGFAVCGDGPWQIVGESRAGTAFAGSLNQHQAIQISTGATLPVGGEAILLREDAALNGAELTATDAPTARHIRRKGFDFATGDTVLSAGTKIGPGQIALALSAGHANISVAKPPTIAILDSGDELSAEPSVLGPDQIPASNGAMIEAMLKPLGCDTLRLGPVPDDRNAIAKALSQAEAADILVTSGGASVGDHDLIRPALEDWGADLAFWKVAMKPGKPLMIASRDHQVIAGLPGNPVSSFVTCFLFVLPLVRSIMGHRSPLPHTLQATTETDLPAVGSRHEFLRGIAGETSVNLADSQDSSALRALSAANCLIDRPAFASPVSKGETVTVYPL
ncbi:MAG: molybdopterin molybdotransferase MoeA [Pseudomonadota bacterium]